MEMFSINFLKEIYHWEPYKRSTMGYLNAHRLIQHMFPGLADRYFHLQYEQSPKILIATLG